MRRTRGGGEVPKSLRMTTGNAAVVVVEKREREAELVTISFGIVVVANQQWVARRRRR